MIAALVLTGVCVVRAEDMPVLKAVDSQPLEKRTPLILLHGINPPDDGAYGWQGFLKSSAGNTEFQQRYKVYLFAYDPTLPVPENGENLRKILTAYRGEHPDAAPFRLVALSLGGLIARQAVNDHAVWTQTDQVIALGVPFHGSPLANPFWMRACLKDKSFWNPMRRTNRLAYWLTRKKFPHFQDNFCWDNFDGAVPHHVLIKQAATEAFEVAYPSEELQRKYRVYAAFFDAESREKQWLTHELQREPVMETAKPRKVAFNRHMMFRMAQPTLASLPLNSAKENALPLMMFNDGISPISSQLWLGRYTQQQQAPLSQESQWQAVVAMRGHGQARLFEGLDHRDWLDDKTRYQNSDAKLPDWLHPEEPSRSIYEWLIYDLTKTKSDAHGSTQLGATGARVAAGF